MGKQFDKIEDHHRKMIEAQHIFFVGSAADVGRVNISPKGMDSLRVMDENRIVWRNLTGSGNETAGHLQRINRITLMWCSFTTKPVILRCYGTAKTLHVDDTGFDELNAMFDPAPTARQIYDVTVDLVQTSCGFAVPFFEHVSDRDTLEKWAEDKGTEGAREYWRTRNTKTIDGLPTGVPE